MARVGTVTAPTPAIPRTRLFMRYAWGVLAYNLAVILWGAVVRVTGSGAGCGDHWPLCNGAVSPNLKSVHTAIEVTHRMMSGLDVALVALLAVWAFRTFPRGHMARLGARLSAVFLVTEALLGAGLVLLKKVAQNADAWWNSTHLLNTLGLIACLALLSPGQAAVQWSCATRGLPRIPPGQVGRKWIQCVRQGRRGGAGSHPPCS
jgi:heme A synthase